MCTIEIDTGDLAVSCSGLNGESMTKYEIMHSGIDMYKLNPNPQRYRKCKKFLREISSKMHILLQFIV